MEKEEKYIVIGAFLFMSAVFFVIMYVMFYLPIKSSLYFDKFDLFIKGEIVYLESPNKNNVNIVVIKSDSSNYTVYDQRDSLNIYFCLYKNNIAIIYDNADLRGVDYSIGDSLILDGKNNTIICKDSLGNFKFIKEKLPLSNKMFFPKRRINMLFEQYTETK